MKFHDGLDERSGGTIELTAMVNVVLLLLSFFVLAARFRAPERELAIGYQPAPAATGAAVQDLPAAIPVYLRDTGRGVAIAVGQARLPDNAFDAIGAKLAEINMPELAVTVLAEPSLSVDQVARALDAVLASPMKNVALARLDSPAGRPR